MKQRTISFLLAIMMVLGTLTGYAPVFSATETAEYIISVDVNAMNPEFNRAREVHNYLRAIEISNESLDAFKAELETLIGKKEEKERLNLLLPSVVLELSQEEKQKIETLDHIEGIYLNGMLEKPTAYPGYKEAMMRKTRASEHRDSLSMIGSHDLIGQDEEILRRYDGSGRVLAVIDSGMDPTHRAFYLNPGSTPSLTPGDIRDIQLTKGLTVNSDTVNLYRSEKVPFAYNYAQRIEDINPLKEVDAHGQHVSGTIAGNIVDTLGYKWAGVAPNAQLLMMNVFGSTSGTSYSTYIRAMEDAVTLGADAANMSLGSTKGLNMDNSVVAKVVNNGYMTNTNFVIAAGNEGQYEGDLSIENPDFGTIGSPGVITNAITVASLENQSTVGFEFQLNGLPISFSKSGNIDLVKGTFEFVDCNLGTEADVADKDLTGKYALIKRGGETFINKILNAQAKGAVGVVIYNNVEGGLGLAIDDPKIQIPAFAVKKEIGEMMLAASEHIISIDPAEKKMDNPEFGEISAFSNWGLSIGGYMKPDITAPGGNIYSTQTMGDTFGLMSGTSMATPHVTGAVGVVRQKIDQDPQFGYVKDKARLTKVLLMNSAVPHMDPVTNQTTSPRRQGAGILNLERALKQDFTVVDSTTKIPSKFVGNVEDTIVLNLIVNNYSSETKTLIPSVGVTIDAKDGKVLMRRPDELFSKTYEDQTFTIGAGEEKAVTITIPLEHMEKVEDFTNGAFIEGYLNLSDQNGKAANFPFVSFKGEYESLPAIEKPINEFDFETEFPMYWNYFPQKFAWFAYNTSILTNRGTGTNSEGKQVPFTVIAGMKNYSEVNNAKIKDKKNIKPEFEPIVISPNADGYHDTISLQLIAVRDAQTRVSIMDEKGEEKYFTTKQVQKNNSYWPDQQKYGLLGFTTFGNIPVTRLDDGNYTLKIASNAYINGAYKGPETVREIKFAIDRVGPTFYESDYQEDTRTLSFKAKDESFVRKVAYKIGEETTQVEETNGQYRFVVPEGKELSEVLITGIDGGYNLSEISAAAVVHGDKYGTLKVETKIDNPVQPLNLSYKILDEKGEETKSNTSLELGKYTLKVESYNPVYELVGEKEVPFELTKENKDIVLTLTFKKIPTQKLTIKLNEKLDLTNEDIKMEAINQKTQKVYELISDGGASGIMEDYFEASLPYGTYKLRFTFAKEGYDVSFRSYDNITYPEAFELNTTTSVMAYVDIVRKAGFNPVKIHFETKGIDQEVEYIAVDIDKYSQENPDQLGEGRFVLLPKEIPDGYYVRPSKYDLEIVGSEEIEKTYTFEYFKLEDKNFTVTIKDNYEPANYFIEDIYSYYGLEGTSFNSKEKELTLKPGRYYITALPDDVAYGEETTYQTGGPVFVVDSVDQAQEVTYQWTNYKDIDKTGTAIVMVVDEDSLLPNQYDIIFTSSTGEKTKIDYKANDFNAILAGHQFKYGAYTVEIPAMPEDYTVDPSKFYLTGEEASFFMRVVKKNEDKFVNVNFQFTCEGEPVSPVRFKLGEEGEILNDGYHQVEMGDYRLIIEHMPVGYALVNEDETIHIDKDTKEITVKLKKIEDGKISVKGSFLNFGNAPEGSLEIIASANGEDYKALLTRTNYEFALPAGTYRLTARSTDPAYQPEFTEYGTFVVEESEKTGKLLDRGYNVNVRQAYPITVDTVFEDGTDQTVTYRVESVDSLYPNKKGHFSLDSVPGYGSPKVYVENIPEGYTADAEEKAARFSSYTKAFDPMSFTFSKKSDQPATVGKLTVKTNHVSGTMPKYPKWKVVGDYARYDANKAIELPFGEYEIEMATTLYDSFKTEPKTIKVNLTKENPEQTVTFDILDKYQSTDLVSGDGEEKKGSIIVEAYGVKGEDRKKVYYLNFMIDDNPPITDVNKELPVSYGEHTVRLSNYWNILKRYDEEKTVKEYKVVVDEEHPQAKVVFDLIEKTDDETPVEPKETGTLTWKVNYEDKPNYTSEIVDLYRIEGEKETPVTLNFKGQYQGGPAELPYGEYKLNLRPFYDKSLVIENQGIKFELSKEKPSFEAVFEVSKQKQPQIVNIAGLQQDFEHLRFRVIDRKTGQEVAGVKKLTNKIEFPAISSREYKIEIEGATKPYTPNVFSVIGGLDRTINFVPELLLTIKSMAGEEEIHPDYTIIQGNDYSYFEGVYGEPLPAITGIGEYLIRVDKVPQGYELAEEGKITFKLEQGEYDKTITINYKRNTEEVIDTNFLRDLIKQADEIRQSTAYRDADQDLKDAYDKSIKEARQLLKADYTKEDIDLAAEAIIKARNAVVGDMISMLKEDLKALLDQENKVKAEDRYLYDSDEDKEKYDQSIKEGQIIYDKQDANEIEVRESIQRIKKALAALDGFKKADKDELNDLIAQEKEVTKSIKYLNATQTERDNYLLAVARGVSVNRNSNASQKEVDDAIREIKLAYKALSGIEPTEKTEAPEVNVAHENDNQITGTTKAGYFVYAYLDGEEYYTKANKDGGFVLPIKRLKLDDQVSVKAQGDRLAKSDPVTVTILAIDTTELENLVDDYDRVGQTEEYKKASSYIRTQYDKEIRMAKHLIKTNTVTYQDIEKRVKNIKLYLSTMGIKEKLDKTELEEVIKSAKDFRNSDKYQYAEKEEKAAFDKLIEKAEELLKTSEDAKEIEEVIKEIQTAMTEFKEVYTVTFNPNNGEEEIVVKVLEGKQVQEPAEPEKEGYTFLGWYQGEDKFDFTEEIRADLTLLAHYNQLVDKTELEEVIKSAKDFRNSDKYQYAEKEEKAAFDKLIEKAEELLKTSEDAKEIEEVIKEIQTAMTEFKEVYTVTFNPNNGEEEIVVKVLEGKQVQEPAEPEKEGYTFLGWYQGEDKFDFTTSISENIELKAKYKKVIIEDPTDPDEPEEPEVPDQPILPNPPYHPVYPEKPSKPKENKQTEKKADKKSEQALENENKKEYGLIDFNDLEQFDLTDVNPEHLPAVMSLVKKGILKGMDNKKFEGDLPISRAMVTEILRRITEDKSYNDQDNIKDIAKGDWYYESILWAYQRGIIQGYPDGSMKPNQLVTKQELAVIIARYLKEHGIQPVEYKSTANLKLELLPEWSRASVEYLIKIGFIEWTQEDSKQLNASFTRYELAETINKIIEWVVNN